MYKRWRYKILMIIIRSLIDDMSVKIVLLVFLWSLVSYTSSEPFLNATTIPAGSEGSNPLISATKGTKNVNMTCEVFRISDGVQRQTLWTLIRNGSENVIFLFTNGLGQENFENFMVIEIFRAQLTILEFNSSFDNTQMGCGSGGEIAARFDLRIISEYTVRKITSLYHFLSTRTVQYIYTQLYMYEHLFLKNVRFYERV